MRQRLPWIIAAVLVGFLFILIGTSYWRSSGVGPQVQVPMFYDAHYLFPRAWTQEQSAPGVPEAAPLAFYGSNRISQKFVSGSDRLSMLEFWLSGEKDERVDISLIDDQGEGVGGPLMLSAGTDGAYYRVSFAPVEEARGRTFELTMTAPEATIENPVATRSVGGDRLGGSLGINEYNRPGNLELRTYVNGLPGIWWLEAIGEQIMPALFGLRLQQYKPEAFKGALFAILLLATAGLSLLYLVLARPQAQPSLSQLSRALGWAVVLVLTLFLAWQIGSSRVVFKPLAGSIKLDRGAEIIARAPAPGSGARVINDLAAGLWTAERFPEERFVSSGMIANRPGIHVPADSRLEYSLDVPLGARLRTGVAGEGQGALEVGIRIGGESMRSLEVQSVPDPGVHDITWTDLDLAEWAGKPITLILESEGDKGQTSGWWVMPQIETNADWVLADPMPTDTDFEPTSYRFGEMVELVGYQLLPTFEGTGEALQLKLYWRPLGEVDSFGKVFVHLLDEEGELVAQDDGQPVNNAYPIPLWQPGTTILDEHTLLLPADAESGPYSLAVGLYDPQSLQRWPVVGADGQAVPDGRVILTTAVEVSP